MSKLKSKPKKTRDDIIRAHYEEMIRVGYRHCLAKKELAAKYFLSYRTVEEIIYRRPA